MVPCLFDFTICPGQVFNPPAVFIVVDHMTNKLTSIKPLM